MEPNDPTAAASQQRQQLERDIWEHFAKTRSEKWPFLEYEPYPDLLAKNVITEWVDLGLTLDEWREIVKFRFDRKQRNDTPITPITYFVKPVGTRLARKALGLVGPDPGATKEPPFNFPEDTENGRIEREVRLFTKQMFGDATTKNLWLALTMLRMHGHRHTFPQELRDLVERSVVPPKMSEMADRYVLVMRAVEAFKKRGVVA